MIKTFKFIILFLIQFIEKLEYIFINFNKIEKVFKSYNLYDYEILTDTGYKDLSYLHITKPFRIYKIKTESGKHLECADNHILFNENMQEVFVKDLNVNSYIQTKDGIEKIVSISKLPIKIMMGDITVNDSNHRFYSNDILSHNSIVASIFISWYLSFHYDRNVLVVANKLQTTTEIVLKIKQVLQNLPFFLKPGVKGLGITKLILDNGCRLVSSATTPTAGIGYTNHLVYGDEFAYVHNNIAEKFFKSIFPTLVSSKISRMILTSTPNYKNLFYKIYKNALDKKNEFVALRTEWWEIPGRDEQWKKDQIANLGSEELFNQEYGNSFETSTKMLASGQTLKFFNKIKIKYEFQQIDDLENDNYQYDKLLWHPIYFKQLEDYDKFVISVDLGSGIGGDYTVVNIFKIQRMNFAKINNYNGITTGEDDFFSLIQIGLFRDNYTDNAEVAYLTADLIMDYLLPENSLLVIEMNHRGEEFKKDMETYRPDLFDYDIFFKGIVKNTKHGKIKKAGILVTRDKIKQCKYLAKDWTNKRIIINEENSYIEILSFGLNDKNTSYEGLGTHDDLVMSILNIRRVFNSYQFIELIENLMNQFTQKEFNLIDSKLIQIN